MISPLLSNIYLHVLDRVWAKHGAHLGELVRTRTTSWFCAATPATAKKRKPAWAWLGRLGLKLHPQKTQRVG
ncbi:MAG: hypothetical protein IPO59_08055 [Betaproteobacteria bacterium]|nr:hypothetical protein [Betaproteobacteria bacterium]